MSKADTRVARSYTFVFESEAEKAAMLAHAKRQGRTLAGLIKHLLNTDALAAAHPAPGAGSGGAAFRSPPMAK